MSCYIDLTEFNVLNLWKIFTKIQKLFSLFLTVKRNYLYTVRYLNLYNVFIILYFNLREVVMV